MAVKNIDVHWGIAPPEGQRLDLEGLRARLSTEPVALEAPIARYSIDTAGPRDRVWLVACDREHAQRLRRSLHERDGASVCYSVVSIQIGDHDILVCGGLREATIRADRLIWPVFVPGAVVRFEWEKHTVGPDWMPEPTFTHGLPFDWWHWSKYLLRHGVACYWCAWCERGFLPKCKTLRFCSASCRLKARRASRRPPRRETAEPDSPQVRALLDQWIRAAYVPLASEPPSKQGKDERSLPEGNT
jgi:hypothetical protein